MWNLPCPGTEPVSPALEGQFFSVQFSHSVMSDSLRPHELQHARPPCPSPTPRVHSDSRPSWTEEPSRLESKMSQRVGPPNQREPLAAAPRASVSGSVCCSHSCGCADVGVILPVWVVQRGRGAGLLTADTATLALSEGVSPSKEGDALGVH